MLQRSIREKFLHYMGAFDEFVRRRSRQRTRTGMFRRLSLKARLGLGAGLLGLATLLTAAMLVAGMARVSQRLDTALAAEQRPAWRRER